jgi:hypothetical protein
MRGRGGGVPSGIARTSLQWCGLLLAVERRVELHTQLEPHTLGPGTSLGLHVLGHHMPPEPGKPPPHGLLEPRMQLERCKPHWLDWVSLPLLTGFWLM